MMGTVFNLVVPARGDQLAVIADFIIECARKAGMNERAVYQTQTAVDEACANIIYHAYEYEGQGPIELYCETMPHLLRIILVDHGAPFDPTAVPDPKVDAPLDDRREGGLGLFLMRQLMDQVRHEFTHDANVLEMLKQF